MSIVIMKKISNERKRKSLLPGAMKKKDNERMGMRMRMTMRRTGIKHPFPENVYKKDIYLMLFWSQHWHVL